MSNNNDNNILLYTAVVASLGSLLTSFYTHIKHSKCLGMEINTRTQPSTPTFGETTQLLTSRMHDGVRLLNTTPSAPILIPKLPPPPKNYL
jgi:hypothetical protein